MQSCGSRGETKSKYYANGVKYTWAGEFIKYRDANGKLVYGDDKGEKTIHLSEITVSARNPRSNNLGSSGTENQVSGGGSGNTSTSENKANRNSTLSTIKNYDAIKPMVDNIGTALADKYTPIKGLGKYLTAFDIAKDKYLFDNDYITGKRFTYRTTGNIVSLATSGMAGPAVTVGEFTYDYMCSLTSWINNTFTTQNFLNSNLFPH